MKVFKALMILVVFMQLAFLSMAYPTGATTEDALTFFGLVLIGIVSSITTLCKAD